MKILVCGDRNWKDGMRIYNVMTALKAEFGHYVVIQGGANGADAFAAQAGSTLRLEVEEHPADWKLYGRKAGPIRNRQMLDRWPDLVLAFHPDISKSRGTKDCVTEAQKRRIPVRIIAC